ncbi:MAG: ATP-binding cassette domain-containing protein, partial [Pseudomonadota bacterium]
MNGDIETSPGNSASPFCVDLQDLDFAWSAGVRVLSVPRFSIRPGERLFLQGPSGSGKSTLLGVIAGVFSASGGTAMVLGEPFHTLASAARDRVRADAMGVIFQQFNLVPYLTLVENVLLPCRFSPARAERVGASEQ